MRGSGPPWREVGRRTPGTGCARGAGRDPVPAAPRGPARAPLPMAAVWGGWGSEPSNEAPRGKLLRVWGGRVVKSAFSIWVPVRSKLLSNPELQRFAQWKRQRRGRSPATLWDPALALTSLLPIVRFHSGVCNRLRSAECCPLPQCFLPSSS